MANVTFTIPFEYLVDAIQHLDIKDKMRLWDILDEQIAEYEDESPEVQAQIKQALADYEAGNYTTWEQYISRDADTDSHSEP